MKRSRRWGSWRRLRHAIDDFPLERMLEGYYVHEWVGDDKTGGVRRGKFYVWGQGGVSHPTKKDCKCADLDGPIKELHHPLIQRSDYRNRADYWKHLIANWYHINFGVLSRVLWDDGGKPAGFDKPNLLDRLMTWLVGPPFADRDRIAAPHRSKDSIYRSQREGKR